jgi:hypothetical protein
LEVAEFEQTKARMQKSTSAMFLRSELVRRSVRRRRRKNLMMRDLDLFMLIAAVTCGPELAPEACFAPEVREKLLNPV